jgi:6-phosphogluconate dehydrogenase (decarboxylating)
MRRLHGHYHYRPNIAAGRYFDIQCNGVIYICMHTLPFGFPVKQAHQFKVKYKQFSSIQEFMELNPTGDFYFDKNIKT